jgi:hypothetical protein
VLETCQCPPRRTSHNHATTLGTTPPNTSRTHCVTHHQYLGFLMLIDYTRQMAGRTRIQRMPRAPTCTTLGDLRTGVVVQSVLRDDSLGWSPLVGTSHDSRDAPALRTAAGAPARGRRVVGDEGSSGDGTALALRCSPVVSIHPLLRARPVSIVVDGVAAHTLSLIPATHALAAHACALWLLSLGAALITAPLRAAHAALAPLLPRGALAAAFDALAATPVPAAVERLGPMLPLLACAPRGDPCPRGLPAAVAAALLGVACALARRCARGGCRCGGFFAAGTVLW